MLAAVFKRVHVGVSDVSAWSLLHLYDIIFFIHNYNAGKVDPKNVWWTCYHLAKQKISHCFTMYVLIHSLIRSPLIPSLIMHLLILTTRYTVVLLETFGCTPFQYGYFIRELWCLKNSLLLQCNFLSVKCFCLAPVLPIFAITIAPSLIYLILGLRYLTLSLLTALSYFSNLREYLPTRRNPCIFYHLGCKHSR